MKVGYRNGEILLNEEVSKNIYKLVLRGQFTGKPGQFYMVRGWNGLDPFLSRPLSISSLDKETLTFLYELRGKGTQLIGKLKVGASLSLMGPLGQGFDLDVKGKKALVGGGIGIAPILYLAESLKEDIDIYLGFKDRPYLLDEFSKYTKNISLASESGNYGHKGYVLDLFKPEKYQVIYGCGPRPMLQALNHLCKDKNLYISMENRMACGTGICLGCSIETTRGMARVCKEGPVFKGQEVFIND